MQEQVERTTWANQNPRTEFPSALARVLIVDDEPDVCEAIRLVLSDEGYAAVAETCPQRAFERFETEEFDLVVTDVAMAALNGLDLCAKITKVRPRLPVILITGRASL